MVLYDAQQRDSKSVGYKRFAATGRTEDQDVIVIGASSRSVVLVTSIIRPEL
jgi:hypothetical protein